MTRHELPIGIRTFRTVREEGWCYVDRTACAHRLADGGARYFLSRPRRFRKTRPSSARRLRAVKSLSPSR